MPPSPLPSACSSRAVGRDCRTLQNVVITERLQHFARWWGVISDRIGAAYVRMLKSVPGRISLCFLAPLLFMPCSAVMLTEMALIWVIEGEEGLRKRGIIP